MGPLATIYQQGGDKSPQRISDAKASVKWTDQHPAKRSPSKSPTKTSPKAIGHGKLAAFMPSHDLLQRARTIKINEHYRVDKSSLKPALRKSRILDTSNNIVAIGESSPRKEGVMDREDYGGKKRVTPEEPRKLTNNFMEEKKATPRKEQDVSNTMYQMYGSAAGSQRAEGITNIINNHNINNIYIQTPQIEIVEKN